MTDLIIPTVTFAVLAVIIRYVDRSWAAPSAFFALVWLIQIGLSFVVSDYPIWAGTVWWILATTGVLFVGSLFGGLLSLQGRGEASRGHGGTLFSPPRPTEALVACTLLALAYTVLAEVSGLDMTFNRPPLAMQALLPFHFAGPLLGGMLLRQGSLAKGRTWLAVAPLIPAAAIAVLFTGRNALASPIIFWFAGYLAVDVRQRRGRVRFFTPTRIGVAAIFVTTMLLFGIVTYMLRIVRDTGMETTEKVAAYQSAFSQDAFDHSWKRLRSSVFGNISAFSYAFEGTWRHPRAPRMGRIVFAAPLDLLGLGGERYPFEPYEIEAGVSTNVFTLFRPPLDDFGLWGSLVWWFCIGVVQGWAFDRVKAGRVVPLFLIAWFYVDVALIGGSFFRYNAIILSHTIAALYLWRASRFQSRIRTPALATAVVASRRSA